MDKGYHIVKSDYTNYKLYTRENTEICFLVKAKEVNKINNDLLVEEYSIDLLIDELYESECNNNFFSRNNFPYNYL